MVSPRPTVSVIVNTLDRAASLDLLLDSLTQITYPNFEVVVVVGPCSDDTEEVVARRRGLLKVLHCDVANLSMSRNIGIAASAGEFVAFIDDDAVPEPQWLDELMDAFFDADGSPLADVAAAGGWVYDHTGYNFQCTHTGADRLGNARPDYPRPLDMLATPGSLTFPYAPGGNGLYRKDLIVAVGGFDEEFEYYLEETDLSARLIDRGWAIRQIDGGAIHHKFLPSGVRSSTKVLRDRYAVIKNKIYFSMVNGAEYFPTSRIMADNTQFVGGHHGDIGWHLERANMTEDDAAVSRESIERGWSAGLAAGTRGRVALGFSPDREWPEPEPFLAYPRLAPAGRRLRLCFVSQTIPPLVIGGIGRYFMDAARELAGRGHEVHVITTSDTHDTVDLEDGVWVHRIVKTRPAESTIGVDVPPRLAANAVAVADEVERLTARHPLDAVYAAMWDVEQLEVIARGLAPVVTALVTTFAITLRTRPEWAADTVFMEEFGTPLLELERLVLERSDHLHAISSAIASEVQTTSGVELDPGRLSIESLGSVDRFPEPIDRSARSGTNVLFVGRFEKRKGIDLLLGALPELLADRPDVTVVLAGRDDLPGEDGRPYGEVFSEAHLGAAWLDRVQMLGTVDDDTLFELFAAADVFVAPSRFESFGLVYVEGMMAGLPVVALDSGAAREVVEADATATLVPADVHRLADAIGELCDDAERRSKLGVAGRARFEERFSVEAMTDGMLRVFSTVPARTAELQQRS